MAGEKIKKIEDEIGALETEYGSRTFSYDPESDTGYQNYLKLMQESGKKAMEDTVGKASALTGGYANSYAASAGQQVYNDFMKQGVEAQAGFRQLARDEFDAENQRILNQLNMLKEQKSDVWSDAALKAGFGDYSGYINDLGIFENEEAAKAGLGVAPKSEEKAYALEILKKQGVDGLNMYAGSFKDGLGTQVIQHAMDEFGGSIEKVKDETYFNDDGELEKGAKFKIGDETKTARKWIKTLKETYGFTEYEAEQLLQKAAEKQ